MRELSYLTMRRTIGILGLTLPFVLMLGGVIGQHESLPRAISDYYHTNMRDVFVGIMFGVGVFLVCYRGHDDDDQWLTNVAGLLAFGVALFPANEDIASGCWVGKAHFVIAGAFLLTLSVMSMVLFTRTDPHTALRKRLWGHPKALKERPKRNRNRVYTVCGLTMLACLATILVYCNVLPAKDRAHSIWVLVLESVALFAFGISWLVKGETLFRDYLDGAEAATPADDKATTASLES